MENTNQQWQELLEKWNSGNFTRADEQALQRLMAESDAFAREAMDGYFSNPETDHQLHLDSLRKKLREKQPQRRPFLPFYLMAAAAALLLLVVAVWAFWPTPPPNELATNIPAQDSGASNNKPAPPAASPRDDRSVKQRPGATPPPVVLSDDVAVIEEKEAAAPLENNVSEPLLNNAPPAPPAAEDAKTEEVSQNEVAPIRSVPHTASNTGFSFGDKKRSNAVAPPTPSVGWEQFKNDVETKVKLTQAAKDNGIKSGLVSMILDIRPADGKVRSVLFINRLGYGCDEVAEQFVQQYTWTVTPGGPTQIEVEIEFR
jgi:hypothetical protein